MVNHSNRAGVVFDDEFIVVGDLGFDPGGGEQRLRITEKQTGVGLYLITVLFSSGNSAALHYDGAILDQPKEHVLRTPQLNDSVKKISVVVARPSRKSRGPRSK